MRWVGGASVGLACLLGCATATVPSQAPAPPAATAPTASPPEPDAPQSSSVPEADLEWDAPARAIRCGADVALAIPADLTVYVRRNGGNEITAVPSGSPPGGALMALDIGATVESVSIPGDEPHAEEKLDSFVERVERVIKEVPMTWARLHLMASGRAPGTVSADVRVKDDGIADAVYLDDQTPDATWRLLVVHAGPCLIMAVEHVRPDAAQRFAPMLQRLCAANRSRASCSPQPRLPDRPSLSPPSR